MDIHRRLWLRLALVLCSHRSEYLKELSVARLYFPTQVDSCVSLDELSSDCMDFITEFISPAAIRSALRRSKGDGYRLRKEAEEESAKRKGLRKRDEDDLAVSKVFA
jgi:hypothetical protein